MLRCPIVDEEVLSADFRLNRREGCNCYHLVMAGGIATTLSRERDGAGARWDKATGALVEFSISA